MYCFKESVLKVKMYYKIILVPIWKTQVPTFGPETVYPDWWLSKFSLVLPGRFWGGPSNCAETARFNILFNSLPSNNLAVSTQAIQSVVKIVRETNY
jgi:hypothetical protein